MVILKNFKKLLKEGKFKRVYLFFGDENYLKKMYIDEIKNTVIPKDMEMMNMDIFDEKKILCQKISDACETLPFMNDLRLVIVKNSDLFIQGNKYESEKTAEYIKNISKTSILIFSEEKVDKRGKLYKAVAANGECVECNAPTENEMVLLIEKNALKKGAVMKKDVILYFIRNINNGIETALTELEKLISYTERKEILKKDIDEICAKSLESKIFDMVAAIGNKKTKEAIDIYNNMILMKEAPIMILAMIERQFRLILQSKYLSEKGFYKSQIAEKINQREFVVSQCLIQGKNFKKKELLNALKDCADCDANIKMGKIKDRFGVEMIIIKYGS